MPRSRRLAHAEQLRQVLAHGQRSRRDFIDIYWIANEAGHVRLGLVVPRLGHTAVARNRVRRRLREVWRREVQQRLPAWDVVIRAGAPGYVATFGELRADLVAWCDEAAG